MPVIFPQALCKRMFALSDMMRVVLAQYVVTLIAALFCTAVFGTDPGLSAFLGGFYYAAATTLHALILLGVKKLGCGVGANVVTLLFGEFCEGALRNPAAGYYSAALCEPELARFDYFADGGGRTATSSCCLKKR